MKRTAKFAYLLSLIVIMIMAFTLVGCGDGNNGKNYVISEPEKTIEVSQMAGLYVSDEYGKVSAEWSSKNSDIVTVDENGIIKGISIGVAEVQANVGDKTLSCVVTVIAPSEIPVLLVNNANPKVRVGENITISPTLYFKGSETPVFVDFNVINSTAISIVKEGASLKIIGNSVANNVVIEISTIWNDVKIANTINLKVVGNSDVYLNKSYVNIYSYAYNSDYPTTDSVALDRVEKNGQVVSGASVTFSSANPEIATISGNGVITAVKAGNTIIIAEYTDSQGVVSEGYCEVNVEQTHVNFTDEILFSKVSNAIAINIKEAFNVELDNFIVKDVALVEREMPYTANGNEITFNKDALINGERTFIFDKKDILAIECKIIVADKVITSAYDLINLTSFVTKTNISQDDNGLEYYDYDGYFVLSDNINLGDSVIGLDVGTIYTGLRGFQGTFDGRGYTIIGGKYENSGIFGNIGVNGVIKNVAFIGGKIASDYTTGMTSYRSCVLANTFGGTMENVLVDVDIVNDCWMTNALFFNYSGGFSKNVVVYLNNKTGKTTYGNHIFTFASYIFANNFGGLVHNESRVENCYSIGGLDNGTDCLGYCNSYAMAQEVKNYMIQKNEGTAIADIGFTGLNNSIWNLNGTKARFNSYTTV